jgi:hypothetical protein
MNRRNFVASLAMLPAALAAAAEKLPANKNMPANKNIKWALSSALWNYYPATAFTSILDIMRDTGFIGIRMAGFRACWRRMA